MEAADASGGWRPEGALRDDHKHQQSQATANNYDQTRDDTPFLPFFFLSFSHPSSETCSSRQPSTRRRQRQHITTGYNIRVSAQYQRPYAFDCEESSIGQKSQACCLHDRIKRELRTLAESNGRITGVLCTGSMPFEVNGR